MKFYDRVKGSILYPLSDGSFKTIDEYLEMVKESCADTVYYTADKVAQAQYVSMLSAQGIPVVVLDKMIDTSFINVVENDKNVKFLRVDSGIADALKGDGEKVESDALVALFRKVSGKEKLDVKFEAFKDVKTPAMLTVSEESRRMQDMMKMYRMTSGADNNFSMPDEASLVLNTQSALIKKLVENPDSEGAEAAARQIYTLALLSQRQLSADELNAFLGDSYDMIEKTL